MAKGIYAPDGSHRVTVVNGTGGTTGPTEGSATGGTAGIASELVGGVYNSTTPTLTNGQQAGLQVDTRGSLRVALAIPNNAGDVALLPSSLDSLPTSGVYSRIATVAMGIVYNGSTFDRMRCANSVSRLPSAANSNNATVVKASAGWLFHINGHNAAAGVRYLKLYNKATAPTVGTDTPFLTLALPASSPFKFEFPNVNGLYFSTGIGFGLVTGAADNDNTAVTAADILGLNIMYA